MENSTLNVSRAGHLNRQRGMTMLGLLYVLLTLGLIGLVAVKSLPIYLSAYDVRSTLDAVANDPQMRHASAVEIQRAIQRRFDAGYVDNIQGRDFAVTRVEGGREVSVSYEVRRPLFFNFSLVYAFDQSALLTSDNGG